jgi:hypothetical protein
MIVSKICASLWFFCFLIFSGCSSSYFKHPTNADQLANRDDLDQSPALEAIKFKTDAPVDKNTIIKHAVNNRSYFKIDLNETEIPKEQEYVWGTFVSDQSQEESRTSNIPKTYVLNEGYEWDLKNTFFDFPVVYNPSTAKWVNYFASRGRSFLNTYLIRSGRYAPLMGRILEENGLPKDLIFLAMAESGFANHAKSRARAVGPWQFMKRTALHYGLKIDYFVDERRDPIKASYAASRYLKELHANFGSWELAAAAYNAGEGKIARALRKSDGENFWDISKGRYLKRETKNYVPKIMALAIIGKNLSVFGFEELSFDSPLEFEVVKVRPLTDLYRVSQVSGLDFQEIKRWNPELIKSMTPPNGEYALRFPPGAGEKFRAHYKENESFFAVKDQRAIRKLSRFKI